MNIYYYSPITMKTITNDKLKRLKCTRTSNSTFTEVDYYQSLQVASEFIKENAIDNDHFPIDKDTFYNDYVEYCGNFRNVSPTSKRNFTIYVTVLLAHHGFMLVTTQLPSRKMVWTKIKNGGRPRRK